MSSFRFFYSYAQFSVLWIAFVTVSFVGLSSASAQDLQLEKGREAILSRTGCYLVDYSYSETQGLKPGYQLDSRVYDVNKKQSIKEWIYALDLSPTQIRLQHILFAADLSGKVIVESLLKHPAEDWEYEAPFLYEFSSPSKWALKDLRSTPGLWTRRITHLDDGPRYQCASSFSLSTAFPEWSCSTYAPIPGRETRDMGRHDYNTLERFTRVISYGNSWLERQENVKTIDSNGVRTPVVKELGKDWYVRLPDSECKEAHDFVKPRQRYWNLVRQAWTKVLDGKGNYSEKNDPQLLPRYLALGDVEDEFSTQDLSSDSVRTAAEKAILKVISDYRADHN